MSSCTNGVYYASPAIGWSGYQYAEYWKWEMWRGQQSLPTPLTVLGVAQINVGIRRERPSGLTNDAYEKWQQIVAQESVV